MLQFTYNSLQNMDLRSESNEEHFWESVSIQRM